MSLPTTLWRVSYFEDVGWPEPDPARRQQTKRTYERAEDAARMVDVIEGHATHHELIGVHRGSVSWERVDPESLPRRAESEAAV